MKNRHTHTTNCITSNTFIQITNKLSNESMTSTAIYNKKKCGKEYLIKKITTHKERVKRKLTQTHIYVFYVCSLYKQRKKIRNLYRRDNKKMIKKEREWYTSMCVE